MSVCNNSSLKDSRSFHVNFSIKDPFFSEDNEPLSYVIDPSRLSAVAANFKIIFVERHYVRGLDVIA